MTEQAVAATSDISAPARVRRKRKWRAATMLWLGRVLVVAALLVLWQLASKERLINPLFFGTPIGTFRFLWDALFVHRTLTLDLEATMEATAVSFFGGCGAGIAVGLLFATYPRVGRFFDPFIAAFNVLPRIALAPLFILWFGLGVESKIAVGISLTFFIALSSTIAGVRSVDRDLLMLARSLGAGPLQTFGHITLPGAVPTVFSGLRLSLIYAILGVIAAEYIGAEYGLGAKLAQYAGMFQTNGVFAILVLLGVVGGILTALMTLIEEWLIRWR